MSDMDYATPGAAVPPGHIRYLRQPDVLARVGVSWMTLVRWERAGIFPSRRKIGPNAVAWRECDIDDWCASRESKFFGAAQ